MQNQTSMQSIKIKAFKVILVGVQSVGKSSILHRITESKFTSHYNSTVGIDFKTLNIQLNSKLYSLQVWDTAGQQKFRALTASYYKGAHGCICVFDLNDLTTLQKCDYYVEKAMQQNIPKECIYLIGNKTDMGKTFNTQGEGFADKFQINYGIGSAKSGQGLNQIFNNLGCKMVTKFGGDMVSQNTKLKPKLHITQNKDCKC